MVLTFPAAWVWCGSLFLRLFFCPVPLRRESFIPVALTQQKKVPLILTIQPCRLGMTTRRRLAERVDRIGSDRKCLTALFGETGCGAGKCKQPLIRCRDGHGCPTPAQPENALEGARWCSPPRLEGRRGGGWGSMALNCKIALLGLDCWSFGSGDKRVMDWSAGV